MYGGACSAQARRPVSWAAVSGAEGAARRYSERKYVCSWPNAGNVTPNGRRPAVSDLSVRTAAAALESYIGTIVTCGGNAGPAQAAARAPMVVTSRSRSAPGAGTNQVISVAMVLSSPAPPLLDYDRDPQTTARSVNQKEP